MPRLACLVPTLVLVAACGADPAVDRNGQVTATTLPAASCQTTVIADHRFEASEESPEQAATAAVRREVTLERISEDRTSEGQRVRLAIRDRESALLLGFVDAHERGGRWGASSSEWCDGVDWE